MIPMPALLPPLPAIAGAEPPDPSGRGAEAADRSRPTSGAIGAPAAGRRVGVEVEFLGIDARTAAEALARDLGGRVEAEDAHAFRVIGGHLGDLGVEADLRHLHPRRHPGLAFAFPDWAAAAAGRVLSPIVPRELVTGPLPIDRLSDVDAAVESLRSAGATGAGTVLGGSLGLHFNVEPERLDARSLAAHLAAYLALEPDLRARTARGSRRLALALPPAFPAAYRDLVLDPGYRPDVPRLAADYVAANPTRRRGLDMLPILAHLVPDVVFGALPREKVSARPAFHYRLPHARVGEPGWSVTEDFAGWRRVAAEAAARLAAG